MIAYAMIYLKRSDDKGGIILTYGIVFLVIIFRKLSGLSHQWTASFCNLQFNSKRNKTDPYSPLLTIGIFLLQIGKFSFTNRNIPFIVSFSPLIFVT